MSLDIKWQKEDEPNLELSGKSSALKDYIVDYVGGKLKPQHGDVTVSMVINVLADEFPELALSLAEENWIRGYEQGLEDLKVFEER
jgi:hypothetical protein